MSHYLIYIWNRLKKVIHLQNLFHFICETTSKSQHLAVLSAILLAHLLHPSLVAWSVLYPLGQLISWTHGCSCLSSQPTNQSHRTTLDPIREIFVLWFVHCRKHYTPLKAYKVQFKKSSRFYTVLNKINYRPQMI